MNFEKVAIFDGVTVVNKALIDHLQDGIIESLERVDGDIVPNALLIGSKSGKIKSSKYTIEDIFQNGSVGLEGDVIPNSLVFANKKGKLECSGINYEDVVVRDAIVTGASSEYVEILEDNVTAVETPSAIKVYPHVSVYQNGKLLIEGMHFNFTESGDVELIGASAFKDDVFSFVGYGSTTPKTRSGDSGGEGGGSYNPPNMDVLESITQERVDAWDTITTHNHDERYYLPNKLVVEKISQKDINNWNTITTHNHDDAYLLPNKLLIEKISQRDINAWNTITTHNHDDAYLLPNKEVLTGITQENVTAWNKLVENETQNIFQNKDVLEKITQEKVDSWDTITTHNHDEAYFLPNKGVLTSITQEDITKWNTVTTHNHDEAYLLPNKEVLTTITREDIDVWNTVKTHDHDEAYLLPNKLVIEKISQDDIDTWNTVTTHNHDDRYLVKEDVLSGGTLDPSLLPMATDSTRGTVLSSSEINSVSVRDDGTMQVNTMDVTNLVTSKLISDAEGEDYGIILSSGTANSYKD